MLLLMVLSVSGAVGVGQETADASIDGVGGGHGSAHSDDVDGDDVVGGDVGRESADASSDGAGGGHGSAHSDDVEDDGVVGVDIADGDVAVCSVTSGVVGGGVAGGGVAGACLGRVNRFLLSKRSCLIFVSRVCVGGMVVVVVVDASVLV